MSISVYAIGGNVGGSGSEWHMGFPGTTIQDNDTSVTLVVHSTRGTSNIRYRTSGFLFTVREDNNPNGRALSTVGYQVDGTSFGDGTGSINVVFHGPIGATVIQHALMASPTGRGNFEGLVNIFTQDTFTVYYGAVFYILDYNHHPGWRAWRDAGGTGEFTGDLSLQTLSTMGGAILGPGDSNDPWGGRRWRASDSVAAHSMQGTRQWNLSSLATSGHGWSQQTQNDWATRYGSLTLPGIKYDFVIMEDDDDVTDTVIESEVLGGEPTVHTVRLNTTYSEPMDAIGVTAIVWCRAITDEELPANPSRQQIDRLGLSFENLDIRLGDFAAITPDGNVVEVGAGLAGTYWEAPNTAGIDDLVSVSDEIPEGGITYVYRMTPMFGLAMSESAEVGFPGAPVFHWVRYTPDFEGPYDYTFKIIQETPPEGEISPNEPDADVTGETITDGPCPDNNPPRHIFKLIPEFEGFDEGEIPDNIRGNWRVLNRGNKKGQQVIT
jgi:hypothetical protein